MKEQPISNAEPSTLRDDSAACHESENGHQFSLFDLFLILAKHYKMIVLAPIVVAVITAICTLFMPNIYTAKAMIIPGDDNNGGMMGAMMAQMGGLAGLAGGLGGNSKADLYVTMLKSELLRDPIIDQYKLMEVYEVEFRAHAYQIMAKRSTITAGKKDGVITLTVDDKDPKLAAAIANSLVEELAKLAAKLDTTGAGMNRVFLEERLAKAKTELVSAEENLKTFQNKNKAVAVNEQAKTTLEGVAQLRGQLVSQEVQLATLQQQFSAESREVKSIKATIVNLRSQIARLEGGGIEGSMPSVGSMPQLGQEYVRLMRDFKVQENIVELLTKQYEMAKLSEAKDVAPFQVLQLAKIPELKSKPKRSLIVIIATIASCFLAILLAFAREFGARLSDEEETRWQELQRLLPLPRRLRNQNQQ